MMKRTRGAKSPMNNLRHLTLITVVLLVATMLIAPVTADNVAKIDTNEYETLQYAIDNATPGTTVSLLKDVQLDTTVTIAEGKTLTLDLNGKNITVTKSGDRSLYAFNNTGTLTLTDSVGGGNITARGNYNYGTLVMNGGTVTACDTNGGYGIWNYGTFTMNGGTIKVTHVGGYSDPYGPTGLGNMDGATALINDGIFDGKNTRAYIIASEGTLTITPAEGKEVSVYAPRAVAIDDGTAVINGGTFEAYDFREGSSDVETYHALYINGGESVIVNGGNFIAPDQAVWSNKTETPLVINGGYFNTNMTGKNDYHKNKNVTIYCGLFGQNPGDNYLETGRVATQNTAGNYTVGMPVSEFSAQTVTYTGKVQVFDVSSSGLDGFTVTYSQNNQDVVSPTEAGEYDVKITREASHGTTCYASFNQTLSHGLIIVKPETVAPEIKTETTVDNNGNVTIAPVLPSPTETPTIKDAEGTEPTASTQTLNISTGTTNIVLNYNTSTTLTGTESTSTEYVGKADNISIIDTNSNTELIMVYASPVNVTTNKTTGETTIEASTPETVVAKYQESFAGVADEIAGTVSYGLEINLKPEEAVKGVTLPTLDPAFIENVADENAKKFGVEPFAMVTASKYDDVNKKLNTVTLTFTVPASVYQNSNNGDEVYVLHVKSNGQTEVLKATGWTQVSDEWQFSVTGSGFSSYIAVIGEPQVVDNGNSGSSSSSCSSVWLTETPTQTPTPTPTETTQPTDTVPTDIPVTQPTATPESPGFGVLAVLAGLGAVAVLRRR